MALGTIGKVAKGFIGCAAVSLASTFITSALATYGIIDISTARRLLFSAGIVLVAGITTSDYLCDKSWKHVTAVGLLSTVIIGGSLFWLDGWAIRKKAEIDARAIPPPLPKTITNAPRPPVFALIKTPKNIPKLPTNVVVGNQNVTGNTITGSQVCPGGICAGGDITGSPSVTTIIAPRGRLLSEDKAQRLVVQLKQTDKVSVAIVAFEPITNEMTQLVGRLKQIFQQSGWGEVPAYKEDIRDRHITMLTGHLDHPDKVTNESAGLHCIGDPDKSRKLTAMLSEVGLTCIMSPEDLYPVPNSKPAFTLFVGRDLSQ